MIKRSVFWSVVLGLVVIVPLGYYFAVSSAPDSRTSDNFSKNEHFDEGERVLKEEANSGASLPEPTPAIDVASYLPHVVPGILETLQDHPDFVEGGVSEKYPKSVVVRWSGELNNPILREHVSELESVGAVVVLLKPPLRDEELWDIQTEVSDVGVANDLRVYGLSNVGRSVASLRVWRWGDNLEKKSVNLESLREVLCRDFLRTEIEVLKDAPKTERSDEYLMPVINMDSDYTEIREC